MVLPEELVTSFKDELNRYEEENRMPYITTWERDGMRKATCESVIEVLETRFEAVPQELIESLKAVNDLPLLKQLLKSAVTVDSVEEFEQVMAQAQTQN